MVGLPRLNGLDPELKIREKKMGRSRSTMSLDGLKASQK